MIMKQADAQWNRTETWFLVADNVLSSEVHAWLSAVPKLQAHHYAGCVNTYGNVTSPFLMRPLYKPYTASRMQFLGPRKESMGNHKFQYKSVISYQSFRKQKCSWV
jgi:hypothetical protein